MLDLSKRNQLLLSILTLIFFQVFYNTFPGRIITPYETHFYASVVGQFSELKDEVIQIYNLIRTPVYFLIDPIIQIVWLTLNLSLDRLSKQKN